MIELLPVTGCEHWIVHVNRLSNVCRIYFITERFGSGGMCVHTKPSVSAHVLGRILAFLVGATRVSDLRLNKGSHHILYFLLLPVSP